MPLPEEKRNHVITGRVIRERHNGRFKRVFVLDDDSKIFGRTRVFLDAKAYPGTSVWMTIKGASHLIFVGATLRVEGVLKEVVQESRIEFSSSGIASNPKQASDEAEDCENDMFATKIEVVAVKPGKPYLSRLFSFSLEHLWELFPIRSDDGDVSDKTSTRNRLEYGQSRLPPNMIAALAPCTEEECQRHYQFCQAERAAGRANHVWKTVPTENLAECIHVYQNPVQEVQQRRQLPPHTSRETMAALQRTEALWCRPTDGVLKQYTYHPTTCTYSSSGNTSLPTKKHTNAQQEVSNNHTSYPLMHDAVDPAHNLPDPNDERRQRYIEERKRPQLQYMLKLIHRLVESRQNNNKPSSSSSPFPLLQLADIGGGRGYLAIAAAAYFRDAQIPVHVTAVDNNESSLEAGRERAKEANLSSSMSFVLCDLNNDRVRVQKLLPSRFDLVFGLHCCGGLAEAAVELALSCRASFCVSTCCFRSHPELATLTELAQKLVGERGRTYISSNSTNTELLGAPISTEISEAVTIADEEKICNSAAAADHDAHHVSRQHRQDISRVSGLAIAVGAKCQHRAIRSYNAMRLVAAEHQFHENMRSREPTNRKEEEGFYSFPRLRTWQETFPVEHSVQNRILMGAIEQCS
jgi:SAM-dependent methyltransferase